MYLLGGGYIGGGQRFAYNDIYCLDSTAPASSPLKAVGKLKQARNGHSVTLVRGPTGPRLLVAGGGANPNDTSTKSAELVPVTCACGTIPLEQINEVSLHDNRMWHTATPLPDGTVLLVGGYRRAAPERFNPDR